MIFTDRTFQTLLSREILRFTRVWMQTIVPQLLTSLLYLVVFGIALGGRIRQIEGIPYLDYILPGIALMSLITNSQMNSSWSVFDAKRERYIDEVLISPMSDLQITLAYSLGGMLRGVVMGAGVFVVGVPFVGVQIKHPLMLIIIGLLASFTFSSFGTMVGALATRIEHISLITSVIIQPLAFLGGVFYSVGMLPDVLKVVTFFNPIFYTVDAARYVTLGVSDLNPYPTLGMVCLIAAICFGGAWWAISRGPNLRY
jgi:ABC-2 type transport system permease protein